ncbi:hypothetical protein RhiirA5_420211 [Rhizophagus irregularis]|uniref:Uncharacterized protein n=2 Tax=Rhizophagus irregularis TaxID=588596 RepID=A0A2I1EB22_9GLOM|nr:hypothetical protein GLOIN_2v1788663 [Rhizophagus irregularis DAOM 181602=DAOM 197198]PKC05974.1 hypothetical protein RhiirA5_420211 [Rhizophagus irregularis]PKC64554.1 hypothetical protein RhiirA1_462283 [Rhizophagus irregularis]PKY19338.1 hypothetical protein RhiirB3_432375 [Rhizophagus irregularis]POG59820.1 hypothetical protein GLOIN_2v1788663 [Rhizophagus irregularis DAOM 181602=DAOM 197198]GET65383.1 hypothetical protein GLOIN_2v1788663 [Rhizophagus irregularis DAOM 181602=DAOM 197198|eukprot:XP_025166686.1 hypothetical protein GLOIN_2v1788663 [Rhizophagus irregularis DAOM 181602=DAOM 197198]
MEDKENKDASNKPFIVTDKFNNPSATIKSDIINNYLYAIDKENKDEVESNNESEKELDDIGDKSNEEVFQLQNPKIRRDKGRPASTRKYKASHEKEGNSKTK